MDGNVCPDPSQVALVTGCSSGIGRATALLFAREGFRVYSTVRTPEAEAALGRDASELPMTVLRLDVLDATVVSKAVREVLAGSGRIDVLVNNAGFAQLGAVEDLEREVLRRQFEVNVFGAMQLCREVLPVMRAQRSGHIVNVSSLAGRVSVPLMGAYCASKFALEALSDSLRVEARPFGVRVAIVEPGPVATRFQEGLRRSRLLLPERSPYSRLYDGIVSESESRFAVRSERVARVILRAARSRRPRARYRVRIAEGVIARLTRVLPAPAMDWGVARWTGLRSEVLRAPTEPGHADLQPGLPRP